jgi:integrase/recombinase XerD
MTAMTDFSGPLARDLSTYLATLKAAGRMCRSTLTQLRALDRLTLTTPLPSQSIDEAFAKAWLMPSDTRGPNTRRCRYFLLRGFCLFLARHRPETFVPNEFLCPRRRPSPPPHIYTRQEVRRLLDGALRLSNQGKAHPCPIRSDTMHALLLLLATTGLRISEALRLNLQEVDLERGVLSVHQSKFKKSRLVPVSAGTLAVLQQYFQCRLGVAGAQPQAAFFVSGLGKGYSSSYVEAMFRQIAIEAKLHPPNQRGPRLHDFRHTFAVTRLLLWYREGTNVMARLPLLSTYLGHARVSDTQVYLQATAELLTEAHHRFHNFAREVLAEGGRP